jgi:hypothetical protein
VLQCAGMSATETLLASAEDTRPRRKSMLEESLDGSSMTFHPYEPQGGDW